MLRNSKISFIIVLTGLAVLAAVLLYMGRPSFADAAPGGGAPPAMPVNVMVIEESAAQIWNDYSGRLDAVDYVELRPQVSGTVKDIRFEDGQAVKKGDVLYVIDPAPYEAASAAAAADLAMAESRNVLAQKELARAQDLMKTNAIAGTIVDERESAANVAKNAVDSAVARVKQAKIDLDHAYIKAPISGRVGRAEITEGNLVQSGPNAPVLTTILSNVEIYADFDVDEKTYLQYFRSATPGIETEREIPVRLSARSDSTVVYDGTIHSFDNRINTATGTIRARALFKNDDGALLPGMFVSVRMGSPAGKKILIPERTIGTDQDRKFVYVVDGTNKVVYREVTLGAETDGSRVVLDGLKPGEKIITEGLMRIRPDMIVAPQVQAAAVPKDAAPKDEDILKKVETDKQ